MSQRTTGRTRRPSPAAWTLWRRRLRRHRRPVAAVLTFVAVLSAGAAVHPSPPHDRQTDGGTAASRLDVPPGLVAAPVAVPDASVAGLVGPGDRVDVVGTDPRGHASVVAPGAVVLWRPAPTAAAFGPDPDGGTVLMVAVPEATALLLAAATVTGQLSLTIPAE